MCVYIYIYIDRAAGRWRVHPVQAKSNGKLVSRRVILHVWTQRRQDDTRVERFEAHSTPVMHARYDRSRYFFPRLWIFSPAGEHRAGQKYSTRDAGKFTVRWLLLYALIAGMSSVSLIFAPFLRLFTSPLNSFCQYPFVVSLPARLTVKSNRTKGAFLRGRPATLPFLFFFFFLSVFAPSNR